MALRASKGSAAVAPLTRDDSGVRRFVRLWVPAAAGVLVAAVATALALGVGQGDGPRPTVVEAGSMRFVSAAPPSSRASGAGPASLAFVSPRVGFAATTGGFRFV